MSKFKKPIQVSIKEAEDLGFCTVNQVAEFPFTIFNPNAKPLSYVFKYTQFIVIPAKGVLGPNSYSAFKIEFKTTQASVIVGTITLEVEGEEQRVHRLSAVGKYPYISLQVDKLDFGNVLCTKTTSKELLLKNSSEVTADFNVTPVIDSDCSDNFFSFTPETGSIPARSSFSLKVNYRPEFVDFHNLSAFKVSCVSGNESRLTLLGQSTSFKISINSSSLNFGQVKLDNTITKVITLRNDSQLDTQFQFFIDPHNVFNFNQTRGIIAKNSQRKIIVQFRPRNTVVYYQRVYCLARNHVLLFVDLIGTCYDLLIRPIPLQQVHVDSFRKRVIEGRISAIELKYIENNMMLKLAKRGQEEDNTTNENFYQSGTALVKQDPYILHRELFQESEQGLISISQDILEFGFCQTMTLSGQKEIEIVNKIQCKLNLNWINQKRENLNGEYMSVFNVYPEAAVLKPNVPAKFFITFRPLKINNYYYQHLQFYASKQNPKITKKTLEDYELKELKSKPETNLLRTVKLSQTLQSKVKEDIDTTEVLPPLSGIVRCVGHSFSLSSMPFLPIMKIFPSNKLTFQPTLRNHSVYNSIQLVNQSDTPIYFRIGPDPTRAFRAFPRIGLIESKAFAIVAWQFTPRQYKLYKSVVNIQLNDMPGAGVKLNLTGICTEPNLSLENNGKIHFAPTFTGVCTRKIFAIQNLSKTATTYKFIIPEKYRSELSFDPLEKQLSPGEMAMVNVFFAPQQKRTYKISASLQATEGISAHNMEVGYHNPGSGNINAQIEIVQPMKKVYPLEIVGEGSDGSIQLSAELLDFKAVKITEQKKLKFVMKNVSSCSFYVQLQLKSNKFEPNSPTDLQINSVFSLDFKKGIVPANAEISVGVTFSPNDVQNYDLKLVVNAKENVPRDAPLKLQGHDACAKSELRILAEGNYPLLEIIDIRNDTLSVAALWENFQISKINTELNCKLDSNQKKYLSVQNLTFSEAKQLEKSLKHYEWNLGYVSAKSKGKPRKVIITVRNFGGTPLDYSFKFPSDNKITEELWADPGEPTEEEAYEKAILENNIFQIRPKNGRLMANEVKDIELIYSPASLQGIKASSGGNEMHLLRVVFQIQNGKSLVFNLKGTTLGPNEGLLTIKKSQYILPETPIGLVQALRFPIEVNNEGSIKVNYKTEITYEQNQYPEVFRIENPSSFLMVGENHYIYCLYKPLIEKKYNFKVLLHVFDFNKQIQTIELKITGQAVLDIKPSTASLLSRAIPGQHTMVSDIGSKVFFSIEEIDFEAMQAQQVKYRIIIMYNMSKENALTFDFPTQSDQSSKLGLTCADKFTIEPAQGTLQINKFIELKITLTAGTSPSFYEGEIPCHITWANNRYSSQDNDITQKEMVLASRKQSLFLRIRKSSLLDNIVSQGSKPRLTEQRQSVIDSIFNSIISSALNAPQLNELVDQLGREQCSLYDMIDDNEPVRIGQQVSKQYNDDEMRSTGNYESMLLNEQFKDIAEIVMENTFFNIMQETTHQENDLLRVSKKFIQASKVAP